MISYDLIAEEAEMSRQLIRHYYPDPEKLMIAICDALAAAHKDVMARAVVTADVTERLPLFLDLFFNVIADSATRKPMDDRAYDAMMAIATGSETVRQQLREQHSLLQTTIAHEVQISHPDLSQDACRELGYLFGALMYGHWRMVESLGFSDSHNTVSRSAMDRLIASYLAYYENQEFADMELEPQDG